MADAPFTPAALTFFRQLAKHNDREWFRVHKTQYDDAVRGPMLALVERINDRLARFAVDHVSEPKRALYRIHRDTRFSRDKTPMKDHQGVMFGHRRLPKNYCAGFYFHVSATGCEIAAGLYMPEPKQLKAVRDRIVRDPAAFEKLVGEKTLARVFGPLRGASVNRPPKDYRDATLAPDVMDRVRLKQFYFGVELPADAATKPTFENEIVKRFEAAAPVIAWLNETILPASDEFDDAPPTRPLPMF